MLLVKKVTENGAESHVVKTTLNVKRRLMMRAGAFTMKAMRSLGTTLMAF
jgi:hypothetical protein